jgi:hypothetical protein
MSVTLLRRDSLLWCVGVGGANLFRFISCRALPSLAWDDSKEAPSDFKITMLPDPRLRKNQVREPFRPTAAESSVEDKSGHSSARQRNISVSSVRGHVLRRARAYPNFEAGGGFASLG